MITRVLVANRGEIARRVFATCRRLGISTVAVHTDPDAGPHVAEADARVRVDSYLDIGELVAAASASGADAVHPGYGFLSENAGFATAVADAGLIWIGPPPAGHRDGLEDRGQEDHGGRRCAGSGGDRPADGGAADPPVLVKASAGGGGPGYAGGRLRPTCRHTCTRPGGRRRRSVTTRCSASAPPGPPRRGSR